MTLTAILDNQQLRERVLRRMIPVFHMQITERCPSVVLPANTRDLAWSLLHAISSVQQLREVSTDTLDARQLHTECLDYLQGQPDRMCWNEKSPSALDRQARIVLSIVVWGCCS